MRNAFFDWGWLRSVRGDRPTLVIGNLSAGGTGKTPMSMYALRLLLEAGRHPAFLSRGYGRSTTGYQVPGNESVFRLIGDEPSLVHSRFPQLPLAVCEDRISGISRLAAEFPDIQCVVLDDAFQHRRLRGDVNIVLTAFDKPYFADLPLPSGTLRDNRREIRRAQAVVVTKCPVDINQDQMDGITERIRRDVDCPVFFSAIRYSDPRPFQQGLPVFKPGTPVVGFCGLALPEPFREHLSHTHDLKGFVAFPDHHAFSPQDLLRLRSDLAKFAGPHGVLVTTEKDAQRLADKDLPVYVIPIELNWLNDPEPLNHLILSVAGK